MTDYELFRSVSARLETVWKNADRRRSWRAGLELGRDHGAETSAAAGGAPTPPSRSTRPRLEVWP